MMPSPFPGMNPYLEHDDSWSDFHNRFIVAAADAIGAQVQPAYIVKIDQNVFVQEPEEDEYQVRPDVFLSEDLKANPARSTAAVAAPARARIVPAISPEKDVYIEIRDKEDRKLITAVELLSPSNKEHGDTRAQYLAKRTMYFKSGVHLVELDLLRGGPRMPLAPKPEGDYCVMVSRVEQRPDVDVWSIGLRQTLPTIPIPLRAGEREASLELKAVLDRVYDAAGYGYYIYGHEPEPPLSPEDRAWARQLISTQTAQSLRG
jgi:hypothetical protein